MAKDKEVQPFFSFRWESKERKFCSIYRRRMALINISIERQF